MSSLKWGFIAGFAALAISVALGIISGVGVLYIILRAFIFTFVFFGLGTGIRVLINNFFPELLFVDDEPSEMTFDQPGSRVNITLGGGEYAVPEKYRGEEGSQELGNIEDLISGAFRPHTETFQEGPNPGIDRNVEDVYNNRGRSQEVFEQEDFQVSEPSSGGYAPPERPAFTPSFGDDSSDFGGLPDLDAMASAFSMGFSSGEPSQTQAFEDAEPAQVQAHPNKGNKPQPLQGDFDPKELANGIRTVLNKDK